MGAGGTASVADVENGEPPVLLKLTVNDVGVDVKPRAAFTVEPRRYSDALLVTPGWNV